MLILKNISNKMPFFQKQWFYLMIPIIIVFSILAYQIFYVQRIYMFCDVYYYIALAIGWQEYGQLLDYTNFPATPVLSTHLIAVFIFMFIHNIITESFNTMVIIYLLINALFFFALLYSTYKISRLFGLTSFVSTVFIIALSIDYNFVSIYIQPLNDVLFVTLGLFTIYYILLIKNFTTYHFFTLTFISAIMSFFRIEGTLIFMAASASAFFTKKYKQGFFYLFASFFSLIIVKLFFNLINADMTTIDKLAGFGFQLYSIAEYIDKINLMSSKTFAKILFKTPPLFYWFNIILTTSATVFLLFCALSSTKRQQFNPLFLSLIGLAFLAFFVIVIPFDADRYLVILFPIFYILLLSREYSSRLKKILVITLLLVNASSSLFVLYWYNHIGLNGKAIKNFSSQLQTELAPLDTEYDLVSFKPRLLYFLTGKPNINNLNEMRTNTLIVVGSNEFLGDIVKQLDSMPLNYTQEKLDSSYVDFQYKIGEWAITTPIETIKFTLTPN